MHGTQLRLAALLSGLMCSPAPQDGCGVHAVALFAPALNVSAAHGMQAVSSVSLVPASPAWNHCPGPHVRFFAAHDVGVSLNSPLVQTVQSVSSWVYTVAAPGTNLLPPVHALA